MTEKKLDLHRKILIPAIAAVVGLAVLLVYLERWIEFGKLADSHRRSTSRSEQFLQDHINDTTFILSVLSKQLIENDTLSSPFLAGDRQGLLNEVQATSDEFKEKYGITHLYFHQLDKTCFLRAHQPDRFGDTIDRYTLAQAAQRQTAFCGIELGVMGTMTLRHVEPWHVNGELIGYIEVGTETLHIINDIRNLLSLKIVVAVEKPLINRPDWEEGFSMLGRSGNWDQFEELVVTNQKDGDLTPGFINYIKNSCLSGQECEKDPYFKEDSRVSIASCFGLADVAGHQIGRVFVVDDVTVQSAMIAATSIFFGVAVIVSGSFAVILLYLHIIRIEKHLKETLKSQDTEILHRKFAEAQLTESKERTEAVNHELQNEMQKREKTEKRLKMHVNQTPLGVVQWGSNFCVEEWNPAAETIFGYSSDEAVGKLATELILTDELLNEVQVVWEDLVSGKGASCYRNKNITKDGRTIICHWYNTPLIDDNGEIIGVSSIVQDVTMEQEYADALRDSKDRAETASESKSRFLANMSHEIRTPMNAIIGFSDLLLTEQLSDDQFDYVQTITNSANHLLKLINNILDLSRIESGHTKTSMESYEFEELLEDVNSMMRGLAEDKGLHFEILTDMSMPKSIMVDGMHLSQCLINLVGNAIKFTDKGHVIVRVGRCTEDGKDDVCFEVQDSGIGIPKDKQALVFESFSQADDGTCRKYGGTGLGLSISRQLIELMGGTLTLTSTEGVGSTFTIRLPLIEATKSAPSSAASTS